MPRKPRVVTSLVLPIEMAEHVRQQAEHRGITASAYVRLLVWQDLEAAQQTAKSAG